MKFKYYPVELRLNMIAQVRVFRRPRPPIPLKKTPAHPTLYQTRAPTHWDYSAIHHARIQPLNSRAGPGSWAVCMGALWRSFLILIQMVWWLSHGMVSHISTGSTELCSYVSYNIYDNISWLKNSSNVPKTLRDIGNLRLSFVHTHIVSFRNALKCIYSWGCRISASEICGRMYSTRIEKE